MNLHVIYRSCSRENLRQRPAFYSKAAALHSCLQALRQCRRPWDVVFLNDGRLPADLLSVMHSTGVVEEHRSLGINGSYRRALAIAVRAGWDADDIVYFVEDDYLWRPEALSEALAAFAAIPQLAYLSSYGTPEERPGTERVYEVAGTRWYLVDSFTSTFAVRAGILRADRWVHWAAPWSGGNWDRSINLALRGETDDSWKEIGREIAAIRPRSWRARLRRALGRSALRLAAYRYRFSPRLELSPVPDHATHLMCPPMLALGTDWDALAGETLAAANGPLAPVVDETQELEGLRERPTHKGSTQPCPRLDHVGIDDRTTPL
jgi:hypothetical protein